MKKQVLSGRLIGKRLLRSVNFLEIMASEKRIIQVVIDDKNLFEKIKKIKKGSILEFEGLLKKANLSHKYDLEFQALSMKVIANNYQKRYMHPILSSDITPRTGDFSKSKQIYALASDRMKHLLELRSYVINCIRLYLNGKGFIEIQSPKIVDFLTEGKTNAFKIEFYKKRKTYLSISNVLYHHILIISGYNRIYELSPIFRQQPYKSKYQLSEFWVLDFSEAWRGRDDMMKTLGGLLHFILNSLHKKFDKLLKDLEINLPKLPENIENVKYKEIFRWLDLKDSDYGTHLPHRLIKELSGRKLPILWVINAPINKKPFFIKRRNNTSLSAELWTDRVPILASGGERITDYKEALENISTLGIKSKDFKSYLDVLKFGAPPSYTIGISIERLLQYLTLEPLNYLVPFPRFPKTKMRFK